MLCKVAVTGALSCGKSSTCRFLKDLGAYVVSADEIVHQLLTPKTSLGQQIISLLGADVVVNGQIDRSVVAKKVFNDQNLLQSLEKLLHPAVLNQIERQYQQISKQGDYNLFVAEIPLLFEVGQNGNFDYIIAVHTSPEICRQRFKEKTGYGNDEYNKRMARQLPAKEKAMRADYVIENDGTLADMRQAVNLIYKKLV